MKKSLIWILTAIMAITFGALLYFQIMYLENMVKMREAQFSENVMRSLHATVGYLEKLETLNFLEHDLNSIQGSFGSTPNDASLGTSIDANSPAPRTSVSFPSPTQNVRERYRNLQSGILTQYQYQSNLLNEVILSILTDAPSLPLTQRADSVEIRRFLTSELEANGLNMPFAFAVADADGTYLYRTQGYVTDIKMPVYGATLFPNNGGKHKLLVEFPTRETYIFSSVRFVIPSLAFTAILLVIFVYAVVLVFRQKNISEIKTDFINNMTHEFKTPISTISLAAQMLEDDSVRKSPSSLKHLAKVIGDESKRLRFQVDKVLQMSVFDNGGGALKFTVVNVNNIIYNVVNTQKIKAEKFGGEITCRLDAIDADVKLDEMHFTNVVFNLLDNAIKYMREDSEPRLTVTTRNVSPNMIEIRFRDNGIGIRKEDLKKIFEKFYRVSTGNRHDVKGFGLGLAYVKKMVTIFKGTITAESEYGKWSEFIIKLPLYEGSGD